MACWWRTTSPQLVFHRPKSLAYTPVKISRTNRAPTATARSSEAFGSQSTFTPYGTRRSCLSSPMMRAMAATVIVSTFVRYGRLNSLENITASTPPACSAARSCLAFSSTQDTPRLRSYCGSPGRARRWHMAMMGFAVPKSSVVQDMSGSLSKLKVCARHCARSAREGQTCSRAFDSGARPLL